MSTNLRAYGPLTLMCFALGCPSHVDPASLVPRKEEPKPIDETDPRVVKIGEELYPAEVAERLEQKENAQAAPEPGATGSRGTGKPDESNGVCRLYAPELPNPECCNLEYGFDAQLVGDTCELDLYLGESFQLSCGYYFHEAGRQPFWFRAGFVSDGTAKDAADVHDRRLQQLTKNAGFHSEEVPGVPGALWSTHDGLRWAFLPGWDRVRQVSWRDEFCPPEKMSKVLAKMIVAKPPDRGAPRLGLLPKARG